MPGFRRRSFRRGRRPRTRWLALAPNSHTLNANNTFYQDNLTLQDSAGNVIAWSDFVGGTLLRVICNVIGNVTDMTFSSATGVGTSYVHAGLLLTTDVSGGLDQNIWSPNRPAGDFMERQTLANTVRRESVADLAATMHWGAPNDGQMLMFDTNVKRRIRENDSLFMAWYYFQAGVINSTAVGWTGRVLIQLP